MRGPLEDIGGNVFAWLCDQEREKQEEEQHEETDDDVSDE